MLPVRDGLAHCAHAMAQAGGAQAQRESIAGRRRGGIEQWIEALVQRWRTGPDAIIGMEIAVEVDVVLIGPAQPRHAVRIEHVDEYQRAVGGLWRRHGEQRQLGCRSGKGFDAMDTGDMQHHAARLAGAQPGDVDGQCFAVRAQRGERQCVKGGTGAQCRFAETRARDRVIGRKQGAAGGTRAGCRALKRQCRLRARNWSHYRAGT